MSDEETKRIREECGPGSGVCWCGLRIALPIDATEHVCSCSRRYSVTIDLEALRASYARRIRALEDRIEAMAAAAAGGPTR